MKKLLLLLSINLLAGTPSHQVPQKDIPAIDEAVVKFMKDFDVPGMSVAITKDDRLVYAKSYGQMSHTDNTPVTNRSLFRLASVSKQLTSVGIMKLIEQGKLTLDTRVFGPNSIFGRTYPAPDLRGMSDITIGELLHHTTGGWTNDENDPMFQHNDYDHTRLIDWALNTYPAIKGRGTYAYSNFGYCLLGRVIEKITGEPYARFIQEEVLRPCGITDMCISGNTLNERKPNEVTYNGQEGEDPYIYNITRMDSHGGWLATATDMARFLVHVDGFSGKPDILQPATLRVMTTPSTGNKNYACGWCVNEYNNWWHNGSLPGTTTEIIRGSNGFNWVMLTNTRTNSKDIGGAMDRLLWPAVSDPRTPWQHIDQF